jgi:hypothetical protein
VVADYEQNVRDDARSEHGRACGECDAVLYRSQPAELVGCRDTISAPMAGKEGHGATFRI